MLELAGRDERLPTRRPFRGRSLGDDCAYTGQNRGVIGTDADIDVGTRCALELAAPT